MKIAVVGGNLLGCATTLNLALIAEHDSKKGASSNAVVQSVVLYERESTLGGATFRSVPLTKPGNDEESTVVAEVGRNSVVTLCPGSFLLDLIHAANDERNTLETPFGPFRVPGDETVRRGRRNAVKIDYRWRNGGDRKAVRSFGAWDWDSDTYTLIYSGFPLLDRVADLLGNALLRIPFLVLAYYAFMNIFEIEDMISRGISLMSPVFLFMIAIVGPQAVFRRGLKNGAFWNATISLMVKHNLTVGIARGAVLGFVKQIATNNSKNASTCSLTLYHLLARSEFLQLVQMSAADFCSKFKFQEEYTKQYIEPVVKMAYPGFGVENVNMLAAQLALMDGDYSNMDMSDSYARLLPSNRALCPALVEAAAANVDVETYTSTTVKKIEFVATKNKYLVHSSGASGTIVEEVDGIVLCASAHDSGIEFSLANDITLDEVLGESPRSDEVQRSLVASSSSHVAVVRGVLNPTFFGFRSEAQVPDVVQTMQCESFSRFERLIAPSKDGKTLGAYTIRCGADFQSGGLFAEMFESGAEILHYEALPAPKQTICPIPANVAVDEEAPLLVLGKRLVYAAAADRLAQNPEMDAMSALNAASLFSFAVDWADSIPEEEEDGEPTDDD